MTTQFVNNQPEVDRASFQAVNLNLSVLFLHRTDEDGRRSLYTAESTGGKILMTNRAPKIPFMQWVARTIGELTSTLEPRE